MASEVHSSTGRADCIVQTPTHVYIFEFKYNGSAQQGLTQIITQKYAMPFYATNKILMGIAVNFELESRQITEWNEVSLLRVL